MKKGNALHTLEDLFAIFPFKCEYDCRKREQNFLRAGLCTGYEKIEKFLVQDGSTCSTLVLAQGIMKYSISY